MKVCDQTGHKSLEMLRVYTRDAELFRRQCRGRTAVTERQRETVAPDHDTNQAPL